MVFSTLCHRVLCVATSSVLIAVSVADGVQAAAITITNPTINFTNRSWRLGFKFKTNTAITVDRLGFYDDLGNGLSESRLVEILDESGQSVIVSGTVKSDDPLEGWFRYTSVTPTVLEAGNVYKILSVTGSENYTWNPNGFVVRPAIEYLSDIFEITNDPTTDPSLVPSSSFVSAGVKGWLGPNFDFQITAIPTPSLLPALLGMGFAAYRKRRSANHPEP